MRIMRKDPYNIHLRLNKKNPRQKLVAEQIQKVPANRLSAFFTLCVESYFASNPEGIDVNALEDVYQLKKTTHQIDGQRHIPVPLPEQHTYSHTSPPRSIQQSTASTNSTNVSSEHEDRTQSAVSATISMFNSLQK